jgi:hypothetical protein
VPATDAAHRHAPEPEDLLAPVQGPTEPELGAAPRAAPPPPAPAPWLAQEFGAALQEVCERLVRAGPADPFAPARETLVEIDQGGWSAGPGQLERSCALVDGELERRGAVAAPAGVAPGPPGVHRALADLDELFAPAAGPALGAAREIGGRGR